MDILMALAPVLVLAAVLGLALSYVRQPPVLGYLAAGLIAAAVPDSGIRLETVEFLGDIGVILLLFYLGLELSWRQVAPIAGRSFALTVFAMGIPFLLLHGALLLTGVAAPTALLLAFALSLTSTAIATQVLEARGEMSGRTGQLVVAVNLIVDVLAVLVLGFLAAGSGHGAGRSTGSVLLSIGGFAAVAGTIGFLVVPRVLDAIQGKAGSRMILPVVLIAFGIGTAVLGARFGVPVSMGAFLAGTLASEARSRHDLEVAIHPVKELFIAFFFIGIGFRILPSILPGLILPALLISFVILIARSAAVSIGSYLIGEEGPDSIKLAAVLLPVSEFGFLAILEAHPSPELQGRLLGITCLALFFTAILVEPLIRLTGPLERTVARVAPAPVRTLVAIVRGAMAPSVSPFPPAGNPIRNTFRTFGVSAVLVVGLSVAIAESTAWLDSVTPAWADFKLLGSVIGIAVLVPAVWIAWQRWRRFLASFLSTRHTGPGTERIQLVQRTTRGALNAVAVGLIAVTVAPVFLNVLALRRLPVLAGVAVVGLLLAVVFRRDVVRLHELLEAGMRGKNQGGGTRSGPSSG